MYIGDTWNYISITQTNTLKKSIKIIRKYTYKKKEYYVFDKLLNDDFLYNKEKSI